METTTAYRKDFIDNQVTNFDMVRTPVKKPVDHLKPEGDIEFTDKKPYKPAEKVVATKPQDNLFLSGEFNGMFTFTLCTNCTIVHFLLLKVIKFAVFFLLSI